MATDRVMRRQCTGVAVALMPRHRPGMLTGGFQTTEIDVQERSMGKLPFKGETGAAWPRTRLQHNIVAPELSRTYRRGCGDMRRPSVAGTATPNDRRSPFFSSLTQPWVPGLLRQGCGMERPAVVMERQVEIAAREDLVDLRHRRTLGATAKCQKRVFPCGFPLCVEGHGTSHHFALIFTACGAASVAAAQPRIPKKHNRYNRLLARP
jgi:hypothetical protein